MQELYYLFAELKKALMKGGLSEKEAEKLIVLFLDEATSAIGAMQETASEISEVSSGEMDLFQQIVRGLQRGGLPFGQAVKLAAEYACAVENRLTAR
ncbi:MAG: hypothetical protein IKD68_09230 [Solobacterium sp.]|nr:hypothetical protein [Solobacterium sp.]